MYARRLLATTKDSQQINEDIHKVKIESQCTKQSQLLGTLPCIWSHLQHTLDLLRVVGGKTYEDQYTEITDNHLQTRTLQEYIHDRSDNNANQRHKEDFTHRGEIGLCGITYQGNTEKVPAVMKNTLAMLDMV